MSLEPTAQAQWPAPDENRTCSHRTSWAQTRGQVNPKVEGNLRLDGMAGRVGPEPVLAHILAPSSSTLAPQLELKLVEKLYRFAAVLYWSCITS